MRYLLVLFILTISTFSICQKNCYLEYEGVECAAISSKGDLILCVSGNVNKPRLLIYNSKDSLIHSSNTIGGLEIQNIKQIIPTKSGNVYYNGIFSIDKYHNAYLIQTDNKNNMTVFIRDRQVSYVPERSYRDYEILDVIIDSNEYIYIGGKFVANFSNPESTPLYARAGVGWTQDGVAPLVADGAAYYNGKYWKELNVDNPFLKGPKKFYPFKLFLNNKNTLFAQDIDKFDFYFFDENKWTKLYSNDGAYIGKSNEGDPIFLYYDKIQDSCYQVHILTYKLDTIVKKNIPVVSNKQHLDFIESNCGKFAFALEDLKTGDYNVNLIKEIDFYPLKIPQDKGYRFKKSIFTEEYIYFLGTRNVKGVQFAFILKYNIKLNNYTILLESDIKRYLKSIKEYENCNKNKNRILTYNNFRLVFKDYFRFDIHENGRYLFTKDLSVEHQYEYDRYLIEIKEYNDGTKLTTKTLFRNSFLPRKGYIETKISDTNITNINEAILETIKAYIEMVVR